MVAQLSPDELRADHRRLALALEGSRSTDPEALALHFQEAGEPERAAEYAAAAAQRASEALAFDRAARLYRLARELRRTTAGGAARISASSSATRSSTRAAERRRRRRTSRPSTGSPPPKRWSCSAAPPSST